MAIVSKCKRKAFSGWSAVRCGALARAVAGVALGSFAMIRQGLNISFLLAFADSSTVATCDDSQAKACIPLPI